MRYKLRGWLAAPFYALAFFIAWLGSVVAGDTTAFLAAYRKAVDRG